MDQNFPIDEILRDKLSIRQLLDNWVLWRDAGMWEQFRTVWHPEGRMLATWTQGTGDEFIAMNKEGWAKGVSILHFQGAHTSEVSGNRAIANDCYFSRRSRSFRVRDTPQ